MKKIEVDVKENCDLQKVFDDNNIGFSLSKKIFRNKDVKVNKVRQKQNCPLKKGDKVEIFFAETFFDKKFFEKIFEDENILVLDKFQGIEIEGEKGLEGLTKTLAVHRLDRNTSGLVVLAKNQQTKDVLIEAFKNFQIEKKYLCEVVGQTDFKNDLKEAYLFKDAKNSVVKIYGEKQKNTCKIETIFNTLRNGHETSIVECNLLTGKTHQIRAHLAFLGHPILGDGKYGKNEVNKHFKQTKQKLSCYFLKFKKLEKHLEYLSNKEFKVFPTWFNKNLI